MRQAAHIIRPPPKEGLPLRFTKDLAHLLRAGRWAREDVGESSLPWTYSPPSGNERAQKRKGALRTARLEHTRREGRTRRSFEVTVLPHLLKSWRGTVLLGFYQAIGNGYVQRAPRELTHAARPIMTTLAKRLGPGSVLSSSDILKLVSSHDNSAGGGALLSPRSGPGNGGTGRRSQPPRVSLREFSAGHLTPSCDS